MPNKKSKPQAFEQNIAPVIERLVKLCQKYDMPMHLALDVGDSLVSESLYSPKSNKVFSLMAGIALGELSVTELGSGDFFVSRSPELAGMKLASKMAIPYMIPAKKQIH